MSKHRKDIERKAEVVDILNEGAQIKALVRVLPTLRAEISLVLEFSSESVEQARKKLRRIGYVGQELELQLSAVLKCLSAVQNDAISNMERSMGPVAFQEWADALVLKKIGTPESRRVVEVPLGGRKVPIATVPFDWNHAKA